MFIDQFKEQDNIKEWLKNWKLEVQKSKQETKQIVKEMENANPIYIPRNHNVDKAIKAAYEDDLEPMNELVEALKEPFKQSNKYSHLAIPPEDEEKILQTFCGT